MFSDVGYPSIPENIVACYIVEDDQSVADALQALLSASGMDVVVYYDAESLIAHGRPKFGDTVVVDLGLPGISGADLVRWLRQPHGEAPPPRIVAITGQGRRDIEFITRNLDLPQVLRKPPSLDWVEAIRG